MVVQRIKIGDFIKFLKKTSFFATTKKPFFYPQILFSKNMHKNTLSVKSIHFEAFFSKYFRKFAVFFEFIFRIYWWVKKGKNEILWWQVVVQRITIYDFIQFLKKQQFFVEKRPFFTPNKFFLENPTPSLFWNQYRLAWCKK